MCTSVEQGRKTIPGANMKKWRDHQLPWGEHRKAAPASKSCAKGETTIQGANSHSPAALRHRHERGRVFPEFQRKPRSRSRSSHQVLSQWCLHVPPPQLPHDAPSCSSSHAPRSITTLMFTGSSHAPGPTHRLRSWSQYGLKARP